MSEVKMKKGTETLASIAYTRNKDEGVTEAKTKGLPGEEKPAFSYDKNSRITKGAGTKYEYDEANNPTTIGNNTYSYNTADELEKAAAAKITVDTYTYNEVGERTKTEPATGAATSYGFDQASNLTTVTRAKSGETPAIEDTYAYNGDGLRTSQTISGTTSYLAWDTTEKLPLILNDGTNSYIYGPNGLPFEQISSSGTVLYLHHDQQGSTRLLTGSTGASAGTATYDAYGNKTGSTGTSTTAMGYDGQYTNSDTGLVYLRAREYDPATGQFMSVDPKVAETGATYSYGADDPLGMSDPSGMMLAGREEGNIEQYLVHFFEKHHFSGKQAAGIVGVLQYESGGTLSPTKLQDGCTQVTERCGIGIGQWGSARFYGEAGSRVDGLTKFASANGKSWATVETQAQFIIYELYRLRQDALNAVRGSSSIKAAIAGFKNLYEGAEPSEAATAESKRDANTIYEAYG
jgi:RHS repeat-associated protein